MAEKVESFKQGGALWFMDLTVPDELYLLPILAGFLFWITVEVPPSPLDKSLMIVKGLSFCSPSVKSHTLLSFHS